MAFGELLWNCSTKFSWKTIHSRGFATFQLINAIIIEAIFLQQILVSQIMSSLFLYPISEFLLSRSCSYHWLPRLYIFKKVNWSIFLWSIMLFYLIWNQETKYTLKRLPFLMCFLSLKDKNPFSVFTQLWILSGPLDNINSVIPLPLSIAELFLIFLSVLFYYYFKHYQSMFQI